MSRNLNFISAAASLLIVLCLGTAAQADPVTISLQGDTTGGPTFNRPGALIENQ